MRSDVWCVSHSFAKSANEWGTRPSCSSRLRIRRLPLLTVSQSSRVRPEPSSAQVSVQKKDANPGHRALHLHSAPLPEPLSDSNGACKTRVQTSGLHGIDTSRL